MGEYIFKDSVYDELVIQSAIKNRRIILNEEVTEQSMQKLRLLLLKIKKIDDIQEIEYGKRKPIEIVISSYGGSIYECLGSIALIEQFKNEYKYKIITICSTKAMSCGALLLCTGSERKVYKYATILIHKLSSALWGNYDQMNIGHEEHVRLQNLLEKIIVDNTNIPMELLKEKTFALDWYISPEECLKYGIATEII